jgi:hypothetical protein
MHTKLDVSKKKLKHIVLMNGGSTIDPSAKVSTL